MRAFLFRLAAGVLTTTILPAILFAQNAYLIHGIIRDADNQQPLQGVNVYVEGTTIGAISDEQGYFRLPELPTGHYTVYFSYIGYSIQTRELDLQDNRRLDVKLSQTTLTGPMVTVEATQARERVSPVTFNSINRRDIENRYTIQDIPEVISELPSTTFYSESGNGLGYNYVSIRGFDQRRISVMINGIPQNDPEDHNVYWLDFPDLISNVQEIQVQRGAGSSFYGPAAIGGSINIKTNYFTPQREIKGFYGMGAFNTRKMSASYSSEMLDDTFVFYGRLSNIKSDGYRERTWVDFRSYFLGAAMYTDAHNLRLHFYGGPIEDGLAYNGLPKFANDDPQLRRKNFSYWEAKGDSLVAFSERRSDEIENFNQPHLEFLHEYKLAPNLTLDNNLFYIKGYGFFDYDGSWGTPAYYRLTPDYGYNVDAIPSDALIRAYVDNDQVGWLPQLSYDHTHGKLIVGAELRAHRSLHWGRLQKGSGLPDEVVGDGARRYYEYNGSKDIASFYVHHNTKIHPRLYLMSELQYAFKHYRLYNEKFIGTEFDLPYHFVNPRLGFNYNANANLNLYTTFYRTTREPRLKNFYDAAEASTPDSWDAVEPQFELKADGSYNFEKPLVEPETLTGIDLGFGYRRPHWQFSANVYYMDFANEIINKGAIDRFGQPITGNAEQTTHMGLELSGKWQLTPRFSLNGNMSISRNQLTAYTVYNEDGEAVELDGNTIAGFPGKIANLRFIYSWMDIYLALDGRYVGKQYTDNFENEAHTVDPYTVFNLNLRYNLKRIGLEHIILQARINNLLNRNYLMYGIGPNFFPAATRHAFVSLQYEL